MLDTVLEWWFFRSLVVEDKKNAFTSFVSDLVGSLVNTSERLMKDNPSTDVALILVLIAIAFLFLLLLALRSPKADTTDRFSAGLGRLEKIEMTLNEFRTESLRSVEVFRNEFGHIKQDLREIRSLLGDPESGTGGTGHGSHGMPGPGSGGPGGGLGAAEYVESKPVEPEAVLSTGLEKTRRGFLSKLKGLFSRKPVLDRESFDELEAELVSSDVGIRMTERLLDKVRAEVDSGGAIDQHRLSELCEEKIVEVFATAAARRLERAPESAPDGPAVVLVVGVNGAGKTTTIAKLAKLWRDQGKKIVLGAGDTFRAAAVDQLSTWGDRLGIPVVEGLPDAKPSTVAYEALAEAKRIGADILIIDTAGRLHTKTSLMQELEGVRNALKKQQPSAPHHVLLVVDGSTGQNALAQAREFDSATGLTGLVVTKLDGSSKGGIIVAISDEIKIPIEFIGVGEHADALKSFDAKAFAHALFHDESESSRAGVASASLAELRVH